MKQIEKNTGKQGEIQEKGVDIRKGGITGEGEGNICEEEGKRIQFRLSRCSLELYL